MRVLLTFAAAAGISSLAWAASAVAATPTGAVYVTSLPSGADVWIDGTYVGRSPVLVDALVSGKHMVTLTKSGWSAQEVDVSVPAATVTMSSTRLVLGSHRAGVQQPGTAILRGVPDGAKLTLDGGIAVSDARTPLLLSAGTHEISLTTARGRLTRSFTVLPATATEVVLRAPHADETHAGVVALAEDYLPDDAFTLEGKKFVVRYAGHVVVGHLGALALRYDGASIAYDTAPETISGKLFLPLELLQKLTDDTAKSK